jgi:hypothetical protein
MKPTTSWSGKRALGFVAAALVVHAMVQAASAQSSGERISVVSDWSHRHVVFSRPDSLERSLRLRAEPRFWLQALGRDARSLEQVDHSEDKQSDLNEFERGRKKSRKAFRRDWGQSLGANGSTGAPLVLVNWYPVWPAKYTFDINAAPDCNNNYVIFPTNLAGATAGQASVVAYRNLYAGTGSPYCGVANPTVYWSYNTNFNQTGTATNGTVETSPIISLDGTKVGFVETRTAVNGGAILHLLKWHALDGGAINTAAAPTIAANWTADGLTGDCPVAGACMISVVLNGAQPDTGSSPFYDFANDAMYVGDDNGVLHKIVNAFGVAGATPSEVTTGNWPIIVDTGRLLTSPILDSVSGNIFTADSGGSLSYIRETFSTTGTCAAGSPPCLGSTHINPAVHVIPDAPIVDSNTEKVFVFFGNIGTNAAVVQSDVALSASVTATLGTGTGHHLHSGAFDNTYLTGNGSAGSLYMCGSSASSAPTIQRIGFTNSGRTPASPFANPVGTMNAAVDAATLTVATGSAECAPVTELYNANAPAASADQIFFGVQNLGSGTNCGAAGCVMAVNVTGTPATLAIANSIAVINGPSGIIIDNDANTTLFPQSSSLYFSSQGNSTAGVPCGSGMTVGVGCAVKVTQAGLK